MYTDVNLTCRSINGGLLDITTKILLRILECILIPYPKPDGILILIHNPQRTHPRW